MTQQQLFEKIYTLYGPQGPDNVSIEESDAQKNNWVKNHIEEIADAFISLVVNPPKKSDFNHPSHAESFKIGLWEIAGLIGKNGNTDKTLKGLIPALQNPSTRLNAIVVIGELKSENGLDLLRGLIEEDLSIETWSFIIHATTEIGGAKALDFLTLIGSETLNENSELQEQIKSAIKATKSH